MVRLAAGIVALALSSLAVSSLGSTPLSSSIIIYTQEETQLCTEKVDSALKFKNKKLLFVPTLFFIPSEWGSEIFGYCSRSGPKCLKFDSTTTQFYQKYWKTCFKYALENKVGVTIVPHLDDGTSQHLWRNRIQFDPQKKYDGFSYEEIMITPLVQSLSEAQAETPNSQTAAINFYIEGEMGAELFSFPQSNLNIIKELKNSQPGWNIGISLNFNSVDGGAGNQDPKTFQKLIETADFIGISAYNPFQIPIIPTAFDQNIVSMTSELSRLNVDVPADKNFQFSEVGLGGAYKNSGGKPARTADEAAKAPWSGVGLPYLIADDPWQSQNLRDLRHQFHRALLDFLDLPVATTHVTDAYLWSSNSWDPQGIIQNAYADSEISDMIDRHNLQNQ